VRGRRTSNLLSTFAKDSFSVAISVINCLRSGSVLISWSAAVDDRISDLAAVRRVVDDGFDTVYAMSDREDDLRLVISAIFFGDNVKQCCWFFTVVFVRSHGN